MATTSTKNTKDSIFLVLNLILAVITMAFAAILASRAMEKTVNFKQVALFLGLTISTHILFQILLFAVKDTMKDKLRAIIVGLIYVGAAITGFLAHNHNSLFTISTVLVLVAMAVNQFLLIDKEKTKKGIITNILLGITLLLLAGAIMFEIVKTDITNVILVAVVLFLFTSLKKILFPSLKLEKIKLLLNILIKTHTIDVLICLLAFMIAFAFILPRFETTITNFWDAMWYCFTVITTIGFGDFAATSLVGRILTVVLGIYGIVVVAILTSVIVNFYNEVSAKEKARDFIE